MLRTLFRPLVLLLPLLALAGCCGNVACRCNDRLANSLFISIGRRHGRTPVARDTFSSRELRTVYLARYVKGTLGKGATPKQIDILPLPWATRRPTSYPVPLATQDTLGTLVISDNSPFSSTTANANISKYDYLLLVPRDSTNGQLTRHSFYRYSFANITVRGVFAADGCCTCYTNDSKNVRVFARPGTTGRARLDRAATPIDTLQAADITGDVNVTSASRPPVIIYLSKYE